jgi:predicted nucleotidyltransferase
LVAAVTAVARALDELSIPYMVIGGVAVTIWGEPRLTQDVDATIACQTDATDVIRRLVEVLPARTADPEGFVRQTRVLPVQTAAGIPVDLVLAGLPFEQTAIERAARIEIGGYPVRVCTPEDLIVLKIISTRPRDHEDIRSVVRRQGSRLDRRYLDPIVAELAVALAQPDLQAFYDSLWSA